MLVGCFVTIPAEAAVAGDESAEAAAFSSAARAEVGRVGVEAVDVVGVVPVLDVLAEVLGVELGVLTAPLSDVGSGILPTRDVMDVHIQVQALSTDARTRHTLYHRSASCGRYNSHKGILQQSDGLDHRAGPSLLKSGIGMGGLPKSARYSAHPHSTVKTDCPAPEFCPRTWLSHLLQMTRQPNLRASASNCAITAISCVVMTSVSWRPMIGTFKPANGFATSVSPSLDVLCHFVECTPGLAADHHRKRTCYRDIGFRIGGFAAPRD